MFTWVWIYTVANTSKRILQRLTHLFLQFQVSVEVAKVKLQRTPLPTGAKVCLKVHYLQRLDIIRNKEIVKPL
eukprot:TRINITY_DN4581_c0_g1_i1.p2 TRINITY_DN4581_c0_g1~~TRINITY_DN4581_c0_g1_i1.p2  ORF type:complete len:73 (+),score=4.38 TRINITY_DN4581_c0_g1_i1:216-434(+)